MSIPRTAGCCGNGVHFSDYSASEIIIRNSDIQGVNSGIDAPAGGLLAPKPNLTRREHDAAQLVEPQRADAVLGQRLLDAGQAGGGAERHLPGAAWTQPEGDLHGSRDQRRDRVPEQEGRSQGVSPQRQLGGQLPGLSPGHERACHGHRAGCTSTTQTGFSGPLCTIRWRGHAADGYNGHALRIAASITDGQSSTLSWTSTNATSVTHQSGHWFGHAGGVRHAVGVARESTTTYTITAVGPSGSATATATVTVQHRRRSRSTPRRKPSAPGQSSTLSWTTTNATSVSINQGIGSVTPVAVGHAHGVAGSDDQLHDHGDRPRRFNDRHRHRHRRACARR